MAARKRPRCTVTFTTARAAFGPSAMLLDSRRGVINMINYPKGTRLTATEKVRARKELMRGCKELSRRR